MNILRFRRFDLLVGFACVALLGSFAWYALQGPRGYVYRSALQQQLQVLQQENIALLANKSTLEKRVRLMRPENLDPDMLEELARKELKMLHPNEIVVKLEN